MNDIQEKICLLAQKYADLFKKNVQDRTAEMINDDKSHYLIYQLLGVSHAEGDLIDLYQNTGRFLYRYAGAFLEHATKLCFEEKFTSAMSLKIPNTLGTRPKTFEIDCLIGNNAYEIKW
ncbi:MAG TPA: ApaLI family restriction endonuclease, partial [Aggregatilineales bacterium]|nr:ApaLI family restriction endonuclease [Aggregatilineales bacterium]